MAAKELFSALIDPSGNTLPTFFSQNSLNFSEVLRSHMRRRCFDAATPVAAPATFVVATPNAGAGGVMLYAYL